MHCGVCVEWSTGAARKFWATSSIAPSVLRPLLSRPFRTSSSTSASATSTTTRQPPTSKADRQVLQLRYQIAKKDKQNATLELAAVQDRAQISQLQTDLKHAQASKGSPSQLHENIAGKGA